MVLLLRLLSALAALPVSPLPPSLFSSPGWGWRCRQLHRVSGPGPRPDTRLSLCLCLCSWLGPVLDAASRWRRRCACAVRPDWPRHPDPRPRTNQHSQPPARWRQLTTLRTNLIQAEASHYFKKICVSVALKCFSKWLFIIIVVIELNF